LTRKVFDYNGDERLSPEEFQFGIDSGAGLRQSPWLGEQKANDESEKDAKLAQKLGQLQPPIAVLPEECMGQLASFGPA
jgi:hypothetical protein